MKKIKRFVLGSHSELLSKERMSNVIGGMTASATPCTIYQQFYNYAWGIPILDSRTYVGKCIKRDGVEMCVAVDNENIYVVGKCSS